MAPFLEVELENEEPYECQLRTAVKAASDERLRIVLCVTGLHDAHADNDTDCLVQCVSETQTDGPFQRVERCGKGHSSAGAVSPVIVLDSHVAVGGTAAAGLFVAEVLAKLAVKVIDEDDLAELV